MERFLNRARLAGSQGNGLDEMDFTLVLFQQALALRDWIHEARPEVRPQLEILFSSNVDMGLCRDIANGFKHMKLSRKASVDPAFSIVFEYNPSLVHKGEMVVLGGGHKFPLRELATTCVDRWRGFILQTQLKPSSVANNGT
jgi:hypothetical protein